MASKHTRGGGTAEILAVWAAAVVILWVGLSFVFWRARQNVSSVDRAPCDSRLKQCLGAIEVYCGDYNGCLPSSALVRGSNKWNRADFVRFAGAPHRRSKRNASPKAWSDVLHQYFEFRDDLFCPLDTVDWRNPRSPVSYRWRAALDKAWYGVGCKKPFRNLADSWYKRDQIVLYERAGFHWDFHQGLKNGLTIHVAYLDGHVKTITLRNCAPGVITDPASLGEPMYFNFDNTKSAGPNNPPPANVPANHTDPTRYSDRF